uniref:Uncharacterized protein n=1 Tax=Romanomermis culicivorax TaxID=13658 RepID=A0A915HSR0_ROMCU
MTDGTKTFSNEDMVSHRNIAFLHSNPYVLVSYYLIISSVSQNETVEQFAELLLKKMLLFDSIPNAVSTKIIDREYLHKGSRRKEGKMKVIELKKKNK